MSVFHRVSQLTVNNASNMNETARQVSVSLFPPPDDGVALFSFIYCFGNLGMNLAESNVTGAH